MFLFSFQIFNDFLKFEFLIKPKGSSTRPNATICDEFRQFTLENRFNLNFTHFPIDSNNSKRFYDEFLIFPHIPLHSKRFPSFPKIPKDFPTFTKISNDLHLLFTFFPYVNNYLKSAKTCIK